jgi:hypothetical protein
MRSTGVFASDVVDEDAVAVAFAGRRGAQLATGGVW